MMLCCWLFYDPKMTGHFRFVQSVIKAAVVSHKGLFPLYVHCQQCDQGFKPECTSSTTWYYIWKQALVNSIVKHELKTNGDLTSCVAQEQDLHFMPSFQHYYSNWLVVMLSKTSSIDQMCT